MAFLNEQGLSRLVAKIKTLINGKVSKSGDTITGNLTVNGTINYKTLNPVPTAVSTWDSVTEKPFTSVDSDLSDSSTNPVQNKIIKSAIDSKFPVSVANGGTGATTAAAALTNLGVNDYIVAEGDSGIWHWVKYNSGLAECWGKTNYVQFVPDGVTWTPNMYKGTYRLHQSSFPFPIKTVKSIQMLPQTDNLIYTIHAGMSYSASDKCYTCHINSINDSPPSFYFQMNLYIAGTWK